MTTKNNLLTKLAGLILCLPFAASADEWQQEFEVYMLASTIDGDASIGRIEGAEVFVDFGDILEVLHIGGMVHYEAYQEAGWGLILDYGFMDLREDISGPRGGVSKVKVRQSVFQADLMYRVPMSGGNLDYLAGIRWWDNDLNVSIDPAVLPGSTASTVKEDWVDVFVGARWTKPITEKWSYTLRGDVGGFGLAADFTSSVAAGLKYEVSESVVLDMQYKGTWVDYEDGDQGQPGYFAYDTVSHGPLLGVIYQF